MVNYTKRWKTYTIYLLTAVCLSWQTSENIYQMKSALVVLILDHKWIKWKRLAKNVISLCQKVTDICLAFCKQFFISMYYLAYVSKYILHKMWRKRKDLSIQLSTMSKIGFWIFFFWFFSYFFLFFFSFITLIYTII